MEEEEEVVDEEPVDVEEVVEEVGILAPQCRLGQRSFLHIRPKNYWTYRLDYFQYPFVSHNVQVS